MTNYDGFRTRFMPRRLVHDGRVRRLHHSTDTDPDQSSNTKPYPGNQNLTQPPPTPLFRVLKKREKSQTSVKKRRNLWRVKQLLICDCSAREVARRRKETRSLKQVSWNM